MNWIMDFLFNTAIIMFLLIPLVETTGGDTTETNKNQCAPGCTCGQ